LFDKILNSYKFRTNASEKYLKQNLKEVEDRDIWVQFRLNATGKFINLGIACLVATHLFQWLIFKRKRSQLNRSFSFHSTNSVVKEATARMLYHKPIFRPNYFTVFPLPLCFMALVFLGLKMKWVFYKIEWTNYLYKRYNIESMLVRKESEKNEKPKDNCPYLEMQLKII
jgi:hypothetical protein